MITRLTHSMTFFVLSGSLHVLKMLRDNRAVAALEFAIILPVALATMFAVIEVGRYSYIDSKLQEVVRAVSRDHQAVLNDDERTALNSAKIQAEFVTAITTYFGNEISLEDISLSIQVYDSVSDYVSRSAISGENVVGTVSQLVEYKVTYDWQSITPLIDSLLSDEIKSLIVLKVIQNEP